MVKDLSKLFEPKSIAVIGASRHVKKLGYIVVKNILDSGFKGHVYPINPNAVRIANLRCFPDYTSLPEVPDLAIISLPSPFVLEALQQVIKKGTKNVLVFSAGFKEVGPEGEKLECELKELAVKNDVNVLGPNCLGFVSIEKNINATFSEVHKIHGNVRFISQSGAIASSIFDWCTSINLGFRECITLGNKTVLDEADILKYWHKVENKKGSSMWEKDERLSSLHPIGLYLESINQGEEFLNILSQVTLENPVLVLKPGRSAAAKKAMQSHTGSIAGEDVVMEAALRQAGAIRCNGIEDFFDLVKAFSWENVPQGPNVAVVSNAGGPAVMSTDFIESEGLKLAVMNEQTTKRLQKYLPESSNIHNPIDVLGDALADRYGDALDTVLGQKDVHAAVVILTPQIMTEIYKTAEIISRLSKVHNKPIICSFMGGTNVLKGEEVLNLHKIPSYRFPERAVKALGTMWVWQDLRLKRSFNLRKLSSFPISLDLNLTKKYKVNQILSLARKQHKKQEREKLVEVADFIKKDSNSNNPESRIVLNPFQTNEILKSWNIKTPPTEQVQDLESAIDFANKAPWPVVLKIASNAVLHKTDIGGVITSITTYSKLENSINKLRNKLHTFDHKTRLYTTIQIQKQVTDGVEVILGFKRDLNFGPVLVFGAGGVYAEILKDRNVRILPVDRFEAQKLVENSKVFTVLKGYRGTEPYALTKLYAVIEKISDLALEFPELEEFEINPLIVTHEDVWAVDGKGILVKD